MRRGQGSSSLLSSLGIAPEEGLGRVCGSVYPRHSESGQGGAEAMGTQGTRSLGFGLLQEAAADPQRGASAGRCMLGRTPSVGGRRGAPKGTPGRSTVAVDCCGLGREAVGDTSWVNQSSWGQV